MSRQQQSNFLSCPISTKWSSGTQKLLRPAKILSCSQTRSMFIQTQDTPNPQSLKFLPGAEVRPFKSILTSNAMDQSLNFFRF